LRRLGTVLVAALLLLVPVASADDARVGADVDINYAAVSPTPVAIVAGESVAWTNASARNHTVTDDAGGFDSGTLSPNTHFTHQYADVGTFTYHCRLHPFIRGEVDVYELLLDRPNAPASAGHDYPLSGRTALPAGTDVSIEADDGSGSGWQPAGTTTVAADGTFTADIAPKTSASYRAVAGDATSPAVDLLVLNRSITAHAHPVRGGTTVSALVTPASPGGTVVLQLHLRERFGWWPVAQRKLGKNSRATFRIALPRRVTARVLLTLPDGATPLATSSTFRVAPAKR
jgi:plastocyanin